MAAGRATRLMAQANSLGQMSRTFEAWRSDHLSTDQVRHLITAHDTNPDLFKDHEETLVEAVEPLGIFDTTRAVTYWRQAVTNRPSNGRPRAFTLNAGSIYPRPSKGWDESTGGSTLKGSRSSGWRWMPPHLRRPRATIAHQLNGGRMRWWIWPARRSITASFQKVEVSSHT